MSRKRSIITSILILTSLALAQDEGPKFRIYGFADMSFIKGFLDDNSFVKTEGVVPENLSLSFDHLNLYTDFTPNDHLRMLVELGYQQKPVYQKSQQGQVFIIEGISKDTLRYAQAAAKNTARTGTEIFEWGSFSVERAFFQVKFNQKFNLSFGKFITPAGIWNVDHGSPAILTIRQPTQFSMNQLFPKSQIGVVEEGSVFLGDADLSYSLYASTGRGGVDLEKLKDLALGGQLRLNLPVLNELRIGVSGYTGINREQTSTMNITIDTATFSRIQQKVIGEAMSGLISMANAPNRMQQLIGEEAGKPDYYSYSTTDNFKYRENVIGADLKLKIKRVGLQSEITYQMVSNMLNDYKKTNTLGLYGLLSYDLIKKESFGLTPYFCYEHTNMKDDQNNPNLFLAGPIKGYNLYMFGINTKIFTNFGFKLELSNVDILTQRELKDYQDDGDFLALSGQFNIAF